MATYPTEAVHAANLRLIEALGLDPMKVEDPEAPFVIRDMTLAFTAIDISSGKVHRQAQTVTVPTEIAAQHLASTRPDRMTP